MKTGFSFGLTSGVITTLGLIVGLNASTGSRIVVLGGIITIAVADALSDALGIHVSEESEKRTDKEIWTATITTFFSKFLIALSFTIPILIFNLLTAVTASIIYGLVLLSALSYYIATQNKKKPWKVILEHVFIGLIVILATSYLGTIVKGLFI